MKMPKKIIPQPRYNIGDTVIYTEPSEGNYAPRRAVGKIERVVITIGQGFFSIRYGFDGKDETVDESMVARRAIA